MRLALVSQEYPPETGYGGIGTQNRAKAQGLAALGHEVHVLSHSVNEKRHEYGDSSIHVIRIPGPDHLLDIRSEAVRWLTYSTQVAAALDALHAQYSLDLIEFPDWGSEAYMYLLNRSGDNYVPVAIHLHGPIVMFAHAIGWPSPDSEFYHVASHMESACLRLADAVFSSSRCSAKWCGDCHGLDWEKIPIMHTGIDCEMFRPDVQDKADKPTVVFVGKLERNKGVGELVEAVCLLGHEFPDLTLRLIGRGDGALIEQLHQRCIANGTPDLLDVIGFVPRDDLPVHLASAHIFAAPSIYEGGPGFVYLESMACGLPVIACQGSGASEIIKSGATGVLVPPNDVSSLTSALRELLSSEEKRNRMGQLARAFVKKEAELGAGLKRIEAFYRETVNSSSDKNLMKNISKRTPAGKQAAPMSPN